MESRDSAVNASAFRRQFSGKFQSSASGDRHDIYLSSSVSDRDRQRDRERERESGRETERIHIDASLHQLADTVDGTRSQNKSSTQMDVVTDRAGRRREINR